MMTITHMEEISMNCWPALQTVLFDGWVLRFSGGATKRSNSINPLYSSSIPLEEKIESCEKVYSSRNLKTVFKMTEEANPQELDEILEAKGYEKNSPTSVQALSISYFNPEPCGMKSISQELKDDWADCFTDFAGIEQAQKPAYREILQHIFLKRCFLTISLNEKPVCCGLGVIDGAYLGIFDIAVSPKYRGWGFGRLAMEGILEWGKMNCAETAFLQVFLGNTLALKLYRKMGFKEAYKYWYRIKDCRV
jgi:ribosomal protein S18 acetylase RimI-like enzyme